MTILNSLEINRNVKIEEIKEEEESLTSSIDSSSNNSYDKLRRLISRELFASL